MYLIHSIRQDILVAFQFRTPAERAQCIVSQSACRDNRVRVDEGYLLYTLSILLAKDI